MVLLMAKQYSSKKEFTAAIKTLALAPHYLQGGSLRAKYFLDLVPLISLVTDLRTSDCSDHSQSSVQFDTDQASKE